MLDDQRDLSRLASKVKIIYDWLKMQPNWPTNHSLWIPAGGRLDFLSAAMAAVQKAFPVWLPFVVQYGSNTQSARTRPAYFIYMPWHMPWQQTESIPTMVSAGDCRARTSEGLHFRCMDRACKLRGHAEASRPPQPATKRRSMKTTWRCQPPRSSKMYRRTRTRRSCLMQPSASIQGPGVAGWMLGKF